MKKFNFLKTISFLLIIGFISIGIRGYSQSTDYLEFGVGNVKYDNDATLGLMNEATDYTIEAWIYPKDGSVAEYDRVMQRWYSFSIQMYDGNNDGNVEDWYFTIYGSPNQFFNTEGDATLNLDAWNHIAVINSSSDGSLKLFVNGVDVTQTGGYSNANMPSSQSADNLYIGSRGSGNIFDGYIDEVRLKNTAENISSLQSAITDNEYSSDASTAGLFHFDEGSGSTTLNEASSSNATLYTSPPWRAWDYESGHSLPLDNRYVWNGGTDTDYATSTNWDPEVVPTSTDNIIIKDVANDPILGAGTSSVCNDLEIESGGMLSISGDLTVNGTLTNNAGESGLVIEANGSLIEGSGAAATVKQHLSVNVWQMVSSPIAAAQAVVYKDLYLYEWVEADSVFTNIFDSTYTLSPTYGFYTWSSSSIPSPTDVEFTGNLNTGDKPVSWMTYTDQEYSGLDGWNLVGNPYPSGIKWDNTWSQTNLDPTVYVFDPAGTGNWLTYNYSNSIGDLTNGEIPPTQGFYVKANDASPSMTIPDNKRVHTSNDFYKDSENIDDVFNINITTNENSYSDRLFLGTNSDASNNFDNQLDAFKRMGLDEASQLYSFDTESKLAVNFFPEFTGSKSISLGYRVATASEYTYTVEGLENFNSLIEIYLEDNISGEMIDLRQNPVYSFYSEPGTNDSRFVLHFNPELVNIDESASNNDISIYSFNKSVFVNYKLQNPADVLIYDITGSIIAEEKAHHGLNEIQLQVETGYYFVKTISSSNIETQKIFIK